MKQTSLIALAWVAIFASVNSACAQGVESAPTESEQVLAMVMNDIRSCNKDVPYGFNGENGNISPANLKKINGFRLRKLNKEIAIFDIKERYKNLDANVLLLGLTPSPYKYKILAVGFSGKYQDVRGKLGVEWGVPFEDAVPPTATYDGPSAKYVIYINGKQRELSIMKRPIQVYPNISDTVVGCNSGDN
jgi:hypothetical protein